MRPTTAIDAKTKEETAASGPPGGQALDPGVVDLCDARSYERRIRTIDLCIHMGEQAPSESGMRFLVVLFASTLLLEAFL